MQIYTCAFVVDFAVCSLKCACVLYIANCAMCEKGAVSPAIIFNCPFVWIEVLFKFPWRLMY